VTEQAARTVKAGIPFTYDEQLVISVNVSDFERSLAWYREVLGFELLYKLDQFGWGEVTTPWAGVTIGISQTEEQRAGGTVPTFGVTDIDAARRHLESHDVRFDGDTYEIEGMVKLATFYDPDGNAFMLAQSLDRELRGR
jgi:catechol 2,3-dioxygenase-like lactoylglutathione lyase family enzyme